MAAMAKKEMGHGPFEGTIIVFRARRADWFRIIRWDVSGLVMSWKALDQGKCKSPPITEVDSGFRTVG